jgi:hypothetical protein
MLLIIKKIDESRQALPFFHSTFYVIKDPMHAEKHCNLFAIAL